MISKTKKIIAAAFLFLMATVFLIIFIDVNYPKVARVSFETDKLESGQSVKLVQISDLHGRVFGKDNGRLLKLISESSPDAILITGDFIDHKTESFNNVYDFIDRLYKINPNIYYVPGNHEWSNKNGLNFIKGLQDRKINVLINKNIVFEITGKKINICGIDDVFNGHPNIDATFYGVNIKNYTILLSHAPNIAAINPEKADLILSGHTHGGQIRFPFIGSLIVPNQKLLPKFDKGTFKLSDNKYLYIDSGLGTSMIPIRLFNRSQFTEIIIKSTR